MRPRRGRGDCKYPTYETNRQAGVCYMLPRFYQVKVEKSTSDFRAHRVSFLNHTHIYIYMIHPWPCEAILRDPG